MRVLALKLLPHVTIRGLYFRIDEDTIYAGEFREDVNLKALEQEVADSWLEMVRQEALLLVKEGKEEKAAQLKPADFDDLFVKLQLGRLKLDEQQRLNTYYDALNAIDAEVKTLNAAIGNASVVGLNNMKWPEWVNWTPILENPKFQFSKESRRVHGT